MSKASENLISFPQESSGSVLDEILRDGAREMLGSAIEDEVAAYLGARRHLMDAAGHRLVVRNGHLPERSIQTPMGAVPGRQEKPQGRYLPKKPETQQFSQPRRWIQGLPRSGFVLHS